MAPDLDCARAHRPGASEDRSGHRAPHWSYHTRSADEILEMIRAATDLNLTPVAGRTECLILVPIVVKIGVLADTNSIAIEEPCSRIP